MKKLAISDPGFRGDHPGVDYTSARKVRIPEFQRGEELREFILKQNSDDVAQNDAMDPETGEIYVMKGYPFGPAQIDINPSLKKTTPELYMMDVKHSLNNGEFEEFYKMILRNGEDYLDGADYERFMELDYDLGWQAPWKVERKDGLKLTKNDMENMSDLANYYDKKILPRNISLIISEKKRDFVEFDITLR